MKLTQNQYIRIKSRPRLHKLETTRRKKIAQFDSSLVLLYSWFFTIHAWRLTLVNLVNLLVLCVRCVCVFCGWRKFDYINALLTPDQHIFFALFIVQLHSSRFFSLSNVILSRSQVILLPVSRVNTVEWTKKATTPKNNILFWVSWLEPVLTCDWLYRNDHLATEIIYEMHMNLWIFFDGIYRSILSRARGYQH